MLEPSAEIKQLREERAQRMAKIRELEDSAIEVDTEARLKREAKRKEEERLAEERYNRYFFLSMLYKEHLEKAHRILHDLYIVGAQ